jgi:hypothetical protein
MGLDSQRRTPLLANIYLRGRGSKVAERKRHDTVLMSTQIAEISTPRGQLQITEASGGSDGLMLQLTQGFGTIIGPDNCGFIQLSLNDAENLISILQEWTAQRKALDLSRNVG